MSKNGTTLSGIVINTSLIKASNGRTIRFKNNFTRGDDVWLYYDAHNKLTCVEKKDTLKT